MFVEISVYPQSNLITGHVCDVSNGESIPYVSCVDITSGRGTTTNLYGYFSLQADKSSRLQFSCIGYESKTIDSISLSDTVVVVTLNPTHTTLDEVVVSAYIPEREQVQMGKNTVPVEIIKNIPSLSGEADLIKSVSYLPGINLGKEGYANLYVRGGDRGQNLVLLDGIKIYNTSHVGGFLSLFNTDVVKHVDVYKGGFPAQYGGRASSIIDVITKDGNRERLGGKVSLGLISSSLFVESPIGNKLSFYLACRSSYYALFQIRSRKKINNGQDGEYTNYTFYDINCKLNWRITERSNLVLSMFNGHDMTSFANLYRKETGTSNEYKMYNKSRLSINNKGVSLSHLAGLGKIFMKNTMSFSKYSNLYKNVIDEIENKIERQEENKTKSSINDITFINRNEISIQRHEIKGGLELSCYMFVPGMTSWSLSSDASQARCDTLYGYTRTNYSTEMSVYANDEYEINNKAKASVGCRATIYKCKGATYRRIEPRFSFRYMLTDNLSVKANYTMMNQYNHVVVTLQDEFEKEIWLACTKNLRPQHSNQTSIGFFYGNDKLKLNVSVESFYKTMNNLIDYRSALNDGEVLTSIEESVIRDGQGRCRGLEFMFSKDIKNISLCASYTISNNERRFSEINDAKWYPFLYDKKHDFNLLATCKVNKKWSFSGNFALASGAPVTLPVSYVKRDGYFGGYYIYDGINNKRLPLYHRLDIAANYCRTTRKGHQSEWSLNIFNVYAHQNASTIYYDSRTGKIKQVALFSIVPSLSYTYKF